MKKIFNYISKVILALAVVAFSTSLILPGITLNSYDVAYVTLILADILIVIGAIVGAILISSSKDTVQRVGHGLTIASFVAGLAIALMFIGIKSTSIDSSAKPGTGSSTAAIIMIVAAALLVVFYVLQFIIMILNKCGTEVGSPSEDLRVVRIKEWKQILDEGIITQEEYEEKRIQILGLKPKQPK